MKSRLCQLSRGLLAGIGLIHSLSAFAAADTEPVQELGVVTVKSQTPTLFPYRKAWRAFEVFAQHHQLAPDASLRFVLWRCATGRSMAQRTTCWRCIW